MQAPDFWHRDGVLARLLTPLGLAYHLVGQLRRATTTPWPAPVPVICVGNLVAGGAGKTPVALSLLEILAERGLKPAALTRGYGGEAAGPLRVVPGSHDALSVGDEALLLARAAPTWVARDRVAGARAAAEAGADVIVMDDGFQNPAVKKDLALLVVDTAYGFGNGRVLPAGPLRETPAAGLARADAVVLLGRDYIGETEKNLIDRFTGAAPPLKARLEPQDCDLAGQRVFAFAGIGRPEKFFRTLREAGAEVVGTESFADHQPYSSTTLERLRDAAAAADARLVTTAKDAVRFGPEPPRDVAVLDVTLQWDDKDALLRLLARLPLPSLRIPTG